MFHTILASDCIAYEDNYVLFFVPCPQQALVQVLGLGSSPWPRDLSPWLHHC